MCKEDNKSLSDKVLWGSMQKTDFLGIYSNMGGLLSIPYQQIIEMMMMITGTMRGWQGWRRGWGGWCKKGQKAFSELSLWLITWHRPAHSVPSDDDDNDNDDDYDEANDDEDDDADDDHDADHDHDDDDDYNADKDDDIDDLVCSKAQCRSKNCPSSPTSLLWRSFYQSFNQKLSTRHTCDKVTQWWPRWSLQHHVFVWQDNPSFIKPYLLT